MLLLLLLLLLLAAAAACCCCCCCLLLLPPPPPPPLPLLQPPAMLLLLLPPPTMLLLLLRLNDVRVIPVASASNSAVFVPLPPMPYTLVLLRHGESQWNADVRPARCCSRSAARDGRWSLGRSGCRVTHMQ